MGILFLFLVWAGISALPEDQREKLVNDDSDVFSN